MSLNDCQGEHAAEAERAADFTEGFGLDIARIQALSAPFAPALSALVASFTAGDMPAMMRAFEDVSDATDAFLTIRTIANYDAMRIGRERRRNPRVRG
jgi:hypothetical protein